jgi:hypothetical protein
MCYTELTHQVTTTPGVDTDTKAVAMGIEAETGRIQPQARAAWSPQGGEREAGGTPGSSGVCPSKVASLCSVQVSETFKVLCRQGTKGGAISCD